MKRFFALILIALITLQISGTVSAGQDFLSAETRIGGLALKTENERKSSAIQLAGSGALLTVMGASLGSSYGSIFAVEGLVFGMWGATRYFYPEGVENDYLAIKKISNQQERFLMSEQCLKDRSTEAKESREKGGLLIAGTGLLFIGSSLSYMSLLYAGLGAMSFFSKSEVEREYDNYVQAKANYAANLNIQRIDKDEEFLNSLQK